MKEPEVPLSYVVASGLATLVLASALAYVLLERRKEKSSTDDANKFETVKIDRSQYPGGQISVYYGTQTGTAESLARQLEREGPDHGFFVHVVDLEDVEVEHIVDVARRDDGTGRAKAVFVTATYGEGEPPDNATVFVDALKEKASTAVLFQDTKVVNNSAPELCLVGLDYAVFGLGNRQYDHFNAVGKFFDHALERVGGKRLLPAGLGDDDDDLERDFELWKDSSFWPLLEKSYLRDVSAFEIRQHTPQVVHKLPDCPYVIEYLGDEPIQPNVIPLDQVHGQRRVYFTAVECPVTSVNEISRGEQFGCTIHVEVDVSRANGLTYTTADNFGIFPRNRQEIVESVAQSLDYNLDAVFRLKAAPNHEWHGFPFPMPITVKECLTCHCDLTQAPRRSDLKLFAAYAKDPIDQKALMRMAAKEGRAEYKEKILEKLVGFADILRLCPSIDMPLEHFLNVIPPLQSRLFTISSSSYVYPTSIHLTVSVTEENRPDGSVFKGVCSNFLKELVPGTSSVRAFVRPSSFRLPSDTGRPILMIGPGSGVAPMRAILQERSHQRTTQNAIVGSNILYFGCKHPDHDYIYQDELEKFKNEGALNELYLAFSRLAETKIYVQHLLEKNAADTWKVVHSERAHVYVCGGVKMGSDVQETFRRIIASEGSLSAEAARDYVTKLMSDGRYVQELWS